MIRGAKTSEVQTMDKNSTVTRPRSYVILEKVY
jgi:hypothetical protein